MPGFGPLSVDVAYGGNFYAIIEPQGAYAGIDAAWCGAYPLAQPGRAHADARGHRARASARFHDPRREPCHVDRQAEGGRRDGRNAVFYGDRAIDRSPCGTGTSARLAHLAARGALKSGDSFVHESIIGSRFIGRVAEETELAARRRSFRVIEGSSFVTGFNTLWIDPTEPFPTGFQVV